MSAICLQIFFLGHELSPIGDSARRDWLELLEPEAPTLPEDLGFLTSTEYAENRTMDMNDDGNGKSRGLKESHLSFNYECRLTRQHVVLSTPVGAWRHGGMEPAVATILCARCSLWYTFVRFPRIH